MVGVIANSNQRPGYARVSTALCPAMILSNLRYIYCPEGRRRTIPKRSSNHACIWREHKNPCIEHSLLGLQALPLLVSSSGDFDHRGRAYVRKRCKLNKMANQYDLAKPKMKPINDLKMELQIMRLASVSIVSLDFCLRGSAMQQCAGWARAPRRTLRRDV